ncbi:Predicted PurR-regulated permease PerM [Hathewaya proteolytica DSM 3090]|uniref:Predicted PurR-regulated permease PerM n=1 Tax=Hathewaya proteolytica DSM 3090 TaxID=1121331 RepID=A0A1M6J6G7_9CLOT|nr:AI-2E family transporter [Hathewaya proteolytica]SHJ42286.1 Predicted PurR-regulated permease PerM [Hathewaya proteolytica DSM 3090]
MKDVYKKLMYSAFLYLLIVFVFKYLNDYMTLIIMILFLYFSTYLFNGFMEKCFKESKGFTTFISLMIINCIVIFTMYIMARYAVNKSYLIKDGIMYLSHIYEILEYSVLRKLQFGDLIKNSFQIFLKGIKYNSLLTKGIVLTTNFFVSYIMANIIVYFILRDKNIITTTMRKFLSGHSINAFKAKLNNIKLILVIDFKIMFICTLTTILGFYILNVHHGFLLGILCGIFDLLPFVGTFIIFIPLLLYYICMKNYIVAIGLLILFLIIGIIRRVFETKFLKNSFDVHPLIIIVCVYVFTKNMGFIGVLTGSFYAISLKEIWESTQIN